MSSNQNYTKEIEPVPVLSSGADEKSSVFISSGEKQNSDKKGEHGRRNELTTKEAYFASLNAWAKQANISQNAMALFPYYLLSSYPQIFQNQNVSGIVMNPEAGSSIGNAHNSVSQLATRGNNGASVATPLNAEGEASFRIGNLPDGRMNIFVLNEQTQAQIINRNGGYEHIIAPFWKRAVAELVDVFILLVLKLVVTFTVMNVFDLDLGFEFDKEIIRKSLEDDYVGFLAISTDFLAFSSDLLVLEVVTKAVVCFYEAFWTRQCGATPGKLLMGIRIVYMEAMLPLQPPQPPQLGLRPQRIQIRALLYPAETPGFNRSLMRAIAKNVLMTLLFPMCFIMIFFKNNRTAYDIMTKTIVIEDNPNMTLRRQR